MKKNTITETVTEVNDGEFAEIAITKQTSSTRNAINPDKLNEEHEKADWEEYQKHTFWYIVFILKAFSDKDHPMKPKDILDRIEEKFQGDSPQTRNSRNKSLNQNYMEPYFQLFELGDEEIEQGLNTANILFSYNILTTVMGGTIKRKLYRTSKDKKKKYYSYYFEPLFDDSDVMLLEASLISNRSLHPQERQYMIEGLDRLHALEKGLQRKLKKNNPEEITMEQVDEYICELKDIKEKVDYFHSRITTHNKKNVSVSQREDDIMNPLFNRNYLTHLQKLNEAIHSGHCLRLTYGEFKKYKQSDRGLLTFDYKSQSERVINPYALLSCNGHMYLVATNQGDTTPRHFRVDRIMKLSEAEEKNGSPMLREDAPTLLTNYFDENGTFKELLYVRDHPMMGIYNEESQAKRYVLLTDKNGLAILFDHFGADLRVFEIKKAARELFHLDEEGEYYRVIIDKVFDNNMQLFLSHHHSMYSVIEPIEERDRLINSLRDSLDKLQAMPSDEELRVHNKNK